MKWILVFSLVVNHIISNIELLYSCNIAFKTNNNHTEMINKYVNNCKQHKNTNNDPVMGMCMALTVRVL